MKVSATLANSPIEKVKVAGHDFYIKRDDLLNPHFSGNKARKFAYYLQSNPLQDEHLQSEQNSKLKLNSNLSSNLNKANITHLVSYGSIQANSLYSLAALAFLKGWQLHYYVSRIPSWLKDSTLGNYGQAIALGAKIIEIDKQFISKCNASEGNLDQIMRYYSATLPDTSLFIPEGGRHHLAQIGINTLAKEIAEFCSSNNLFEQDTKVQVMLPSGTGTTALFLQTWFKENSYPIEILTCACVGDKKYLQAQFNELNTNKEQWPTILPSRKNFHFGRLNKAHYLLWKKLLTETQIEFELLYDPVGWQCLFDYLFDDNTSKAANAPIIYIHQGGLIGNQTMLPRYKRKYPELF